MKEQKSNFEITMTNKERLLIFLPIVFVIGIVAIFFKCGSNRDYYNRYLKNDIYNGRIIKKFQDENNHGAAKLILYDNFNEIEIDAQDWLNLWETSSVGDSIFKRNNDLKLYLVKAKKSDTISFDYNQNRTGFTIIKRFE